MPSNSPKRTLRCANCKSTEFVQQQIVTVRTPVDVQRKGQTIVATANDDQQWVIANPRGAQIVCGNCNRPLTNVKLDNDVFFRLQHTPEWEEALLKIHFFLWPHNYPLERQREHPAYYDGWESFDWSAGDAIENIGVMIVDGLFEHPSAPLGYKSTGRERAALRERQSRGEES